MKIAFNNFLTTLRRYKTASVLNIVGLTLAFTAFYVIASQVWYSMTYNRAIAHADRIYLLTPQWNSHDAENATWSANCPMPVTVETFGLSPDVEIGGCMRLYPTTGHVWRRRSEYNFDKHHFNVHKATPEIVDLFSFRTVAGDLKGFAEPRTLILSRSAAEQLQLGVGDPLFLEGGQWFDSGKPEALYTVVGIFEDFPRNTLLHDKHIFYCNEEEGDQSNSNWNNSFFVRLKEGADPQGFIDIWQNRYASWYLGMMQKWRERHPEYTYEEGEELQPLQLAAIDEMYYGTRIDSRGLEQGSAGSTLTLVAIALAIVAIAFINFVNFFLALVPVRMRAVNICKVFGAGRGTLRRSFLFEAIGLVGVAMAAMLYLMIAVQETPIADCVTSSLALADNLPVIALMGTILVVMALTAAAWPAFYITRFNASMAVRAGFAGSQAGRRLRSLLVGVQFTVSMILIILSAIFYLQYRHMLREEIGFDRENILTFENYQLRSHCNAVIERLEQYPDVAGVTASKNIILGSNSIWGREYKDKMYQLYVWSVRYNLPEVLGIGMVQGNSFTPQSSARREMLISEKLHREIGLSLDEEIGENRICGIMKEVRLLPVSDPAVYSALLCNSSDGFYTFYLRLRAGADIEAACDYIRKTVGEFAPDSDEPEIRLLDEVIAKFYESTKKQTVIVTLFALLAVVISLMGVFGVVLFETQHRRREIAVRKVFGASTASLVGILNRRYAAIAALCFVIAAPVARYAAERWLSQFASRIGMPYWIFFAAGALVIGLTAGLVTLRSWRAANENPSHVMKTN